MALGWTPYDVDGRNYDVLGLADAADHLFIMSYCLQSQARSRGVSGLFPRQCPPPFLTSSGETSAQVWTHGCVASANSPAKQSLHGLDQFVALGVPPEKLIFAPAWCVVPLVPPQLATRTNKHTRPQTHPAACLDDCRNGFAYPCIGAMDPQADLCQMQPTQFVGAPCSDAAGVEARIRSCSWEQ